VAPTSAATVPAGVQPVAPQPVQGQDQNLGTLFIQIQQLQQQIMALNGKLEEQANEVRILREQSLQRYMDLDQRLSGGAAAGAAVGGAATAVDPIDASGDGVINAAPAGAGTAPVAAQQGEDEAYRAAYSLVQSQKFDQAVTAFQQFQRNYPAGKYAANAYYWLGELYLVVQPPDLESSRQAFTMLLSQYPDNSKAPDALYKLGKVQFMKGNREKAKEYLDQVISRYGSTNSSAVKLARDFLAENY
jgi:tol-pal system protein YbgF